MFEEYIEMPEYQNIQTRMLGADSFPYRNVSVTEEVFCLAAEALDAVFFVGLQEAYDISVEVLLREYGQTLNITIAKERDQNTKQLREQKMKLSSNEALMRRLREINHFDLDLYSLGPSLAFHLCICRSDDDCVR